MWRSNYDMPSDDFLSERDGSFMGTDSPAICFCCDAYVPAGSWRRSMGSEMVREDALISGAPAWEICGRRIEQSLSTGCRRRTQTSGRMWTRGAARECGCDGEWFDIMLSDFLLRWDLEPLLAIVLGTPRCLPSLAIATWFACVSAWEADFKDDLRTQRARSTQRPKISTVVHHELGCINFISAPHENLFSVV